MKRLLWSLAVISLIGAVAFSQSSAGVWMPGQTGITSLAMPDGTLSEPAFSFALDPDNGIYRSATNTVGLVAGGVDAMDILSTQISVNVHDLSIAATMGLGTVNGGPSNAVSYIGLSASKPSLQITAVANRTNDYGHGGGTDPTVFIHSITAAATATNEYMSLKHDQTDAVIATGKGALSLAPANGFIRLSGVAFGSLGTPVNGTFAYCSDCTIANPCAGSGNGALAKRLNGVWVCN